MTRNATIATIGAAVAAVLVIALAAVMLGNPTAAPSPSLAQASERPTNTVATASDPAGAASSAPTPTSLPTATPLPTPSPSPTPIPTPPTVPAPLTGRPVSPENAARHPIAVMIDDLAAARPQSGLASASVVWQAPAEGGIPRYMAVFQDNMPEEVGPVRSSRYYYIAWAAEWRTVYIHAGGSPGALATLRAKGNGQLVYNGDEFRHSGTFYRLKTRSAPHNLYTTGPRMRALGKRLGAKDQTYQTVWQFAPDAPLESRPSGGTITVKYPYNLIKYSYQRATNTYLRSVTREGKQIDAADKIRIAPKNVVVMRMSFGPLNDGHPGAPRLEAKVIGSGTAWISTNGRTIKGTWKKTALTKPTKFYDKKGKEVTLTIGQTFVQVVPNSYPVVFKAGSDQPAATAAPSPSS